MARRTLLVLVVLGIAAVAGPGATSNVALAGITFVVDDGGVDCRAGGPADFTSVKLAIAATTANQTVFVCNGTYEEGTIIVSQPNVTLLGPGATPEADGVATITKAPLADSATILFFTSAADSAVRGLDLDNTPPDGAVFSAGFQGAANGLEISDNLVRNATLDGIGLNPFPAASNNVTIARNTVSTIPSLVTFATGINCSCTNSVIEDNTIAGLVNDPAISYTGNNGTIRRNTVTSGTANIMSNGGVFQDNFIDGIGGTAPLLRVVGSPVSALNNSMRNGAGYGLEVALQAFSVPNSTDAIVQGNDFESIAGGIQLRDDDPTDAFGIFADIGNAAIDRNTFDNVGGSLTDDFYLLNLVGVPNDIPAENNNWGFCTEAAIEQEVRHDPDNRALGLVDFVPFINPFVCPTLFGDVTCNDAFNASDALAIFIDESGLIAQQTPPCPDIGQVVDIADASPHPWGDNDCDGDVDSTDARAVLAALAGLPYARAAGCPLVGAPVVVGLP